MKIILDDIRGFPKSGYNCVRNYEDCILLLSIFQNNLEFISLDYDLGTEHTGYDVLVYMHLLGIEPKHINIHSDHCIGAPKMKAFAETYFKNTVITDNKIK